MARERKIGKVEPVKKIWLSKKETAAYLGVSERYITDNLNTNPEVAMYKMSGRCTLYNMENIDKVVRKTKI